LTDGTDIPRWAGELGQETWDRINELLYDGWQPAAVRRELKIPETHKRSLEMYARKFSHRIVLAPLARLTETLASGCADLGPEFIRLLRLCVNQAMTNPKAQPRVAAILGRIMGKILEIGAGKEEAQARREEQRQREHIGRDYAEAMRRILADYGVRCDDGGKSG
jgi:hypothetical protein